ncbi:MAG: hypothetical protein WBD20_13535 [Pirellulaceae bacterium]
MDQQDVQQIEQIIEEAIADAFKQHASEIPKKASRRTIHLMAKASAAVYECSVEVSGKKK